MPNPRTGRWCFNPLPSLTRGETILSDPESRRACGFNPLPSLTRGETLTFAAPAGSGTVFQPTPLAHARGDRMPPPVTALSHVFQPTPLAHARGDGHSLSRSLRRRTCFNPLPSLTRGETRRRGP